MSSLQTYTERTVRSSGAPAQNTLNVQYDPDAFGAGIGRALMNIGADFQQTGAVIEQKKQQKKAADAVSIQAQMDDAVRPVLFDSTSGAYAKLGGNAMGVTKDTETRLEDIRKQYLDGVEDPELKSLLTKMWETSRSQVLDTVSRHELGQLTAYRQDSVNATKLGAIQDGYNYYNNEEMQATAIEKVNRAIDANMLGLPDTAIAEEKKNSVSKIRLAAVSRLVQEDPNAAFAYVEKYKAQLYGQDAVTANNLIAVAKEDHDARAIVAQITASGMTANRLFSSIESAESAGDNTAVSPDGALGIMQVMPDTAREQAKLLGISGFDWLTDQQVKDKIAANTPESKALNQMLGRSYLQRMLERYKGDLEAALVAYNAGPKWADAFLQANVGKLPGQRSYDIADNPRLASETKPYVAKVLGNAGIATGGVAPGARMTADNWTLKHFKPEDLVAPTSGGNWVDSIAAQGLDAVADQFYRLFPNTPIRVNEAPDPNGNTTGRRRGTADPADNPHASKSQHLKGNAFDVQIQGWSDEEKKAFLMAARQQGFRGIGFYEGSTGHLHIDMGRERTWGTMPEWAKNAMKVPIKDLPSEPTLYQFTNSANDMPAGDEDTVAAAGAATTEAGGANPFASTETPDRAAWLQQANFITDTSKRERVMALLNNVAAIRSAEIAQQQEELKQKAWQITIADDVSAIPITLRMQLAPEFINSLYAYKKNVASGSFPKNDEAWYAVSMMPPEELAKADIYTEFRPLLDNEHFDKAVALKREAMAKMDGKEYDSNVIANQRSRSQIVSDIADKQGWTGSNKRKAAVFNIRFGELIDAAQDRLPVGGRLSEQDMQDIADKLLIEDQNAWVSGNFAYATEDPNQFIAARSWDEVQADDQKVLVNSFSRRWGRNPTNEEAVTLYNSAIQVWLGGKPEIPDTDKEQLRASLQSYYGSAKKVTDEDVTNAYAKYLLELLGRPGARR